MLPKFASIVPDSDADRRYLVELKSSEDRNFDRYSMIRDVCRSRRSSSVGSNAARQRGPVDTALWSSSTYGIEKADPSGTGFFVW